MRRLLIAVLLIGAVTFVPTTAGATTGKKLTFTVGQLQNVDSLNVTVGGLVIDYEIWNLIWPSLTNMAAKDFSAEPAMAESWTSSADKLTWTYKMRSGMKWSDGEPMTADDVKYTIDRANEEQWNSHISITANLTATVVDADTLEIKTSVPDPRLPALGAYIIPKHIYEKVSKDEMPNYAAEDKVGGGPFMIGEVQKEFTRLVRNPNWFGKKPAMDEVIFQFYADSNAQFQALKSGEIDALDGVPEQSYATLKDSGNIEGIPGNQGGFSRGHGDMPVLTGLENADRTVPMFQRVSGSDGIHADPVNTGDTAHRVPDRGAPARGLLFQGDQRLPVFVGE